MASAFQHPTKIAKLNLVSKDEIKNINQLLYGVRSRLSKHFPSIEVYSTDELVIFLHEELEIYNALTPDENITFKDNWLIECAYHDLVKGALRLVIGSYNSIVRG